MRDTAARAEAEDEDFAREKADIMHEIEALEEDSSAISEGLSKSPSMSSRDIATFRNMSFSTLPATSQRQLHDDDSEHLAGQTSESLSNVLSHASMSNVLSHASILGPQPSANEGKGANGATP
jgi:hypothetical protein